MKLPQIIKRAIDIVAAILLLVILSPVLALTMFLIWALEGRPIFYISKRHISVDRHVSIYKFRTMVKDARSPKYRLSERYMRDGYLDIPLDCEVYTPIGRLLERLQLVEVLQFFNIIFHGMSFIGNRPLPEANLQLLDKFHGWEKRFDSPMGITGIAQIVGKWNLQPCERIELEKLYSEIYKNGNVLKLDFYIAIWTVRLILFGKAVPLNRIMQALERLRTPPKDTGGGCI